MRKITLAMAACVALSLAAPAFAAGAAHGRLAQATTATTIVKPNPAVKRAVVRHYSAARHHCRVVVVKRHVGHRVIVTKVRRCR